MYCEFKKYVSDVTYAKIAMMHIKTQPKMSLK